MGSDGGRVDQELPGVNQDLRAQENYWKPKVHLHRVSWPAQLEFGGGGALKLV